MRSFQLSPGKLDLNSLREIYQQPVHLSLNAADYSQITAATQLIDSLLAKGNTIYGINTGFGILANTRISEDKLQQLQRSLVLSHATGVGELLSDNIVRLMMVLKINSLAQGYSGVRPEIIDALIALVNAQVYPCIPAKGSVGASGDLAPLAHLSAALLGVGDVRVDGRIISALEGLKHAHLKPFELAPKEGLALLNGTQTSTAIALAALFTTENLFAAALVTGSLSVDAAAGSDVPFDARIHAIRGHEDQIAVASAYRELLTKSQIRESHAECDRVQDPYSLRCQPQVMGACLAHLRFAASSLLVEANAVSDNPLIFTEQQEILSGGNFHAQPVAMAADTLALSIAEIGNIAERRIALLVDPHMSNGLPAFLVPESGLNSGFMIAHVTAAALTSENKSLAHPASVDSIPTSANQEDHVSMAAFAACRLLTMVDNTAGILAIELLAACQGIDLRSPHKTSPALQKALDLLRKHVTFYDKDRYFAPDIAAAKQLILEGKFNTFVPERLLPSLRSAGE